MLELAVAPGHIQMVGFDLDGTLIEGNTWDLCHDAAGLDVRSNRAWQEDYWSGRITYQQWLNLIAKMYRRQHVRRRLLEEALSEFTLTPGAKEVTEYLHERGYKLAIVSGAPDLRVRIVARQLGIRYWRTNTSFIFDFMGRVERIVSHGTDFDVKEMLFRAVCEEVAVSPERAAFVGNEPNDLPVFTLTGRGIVYASDDPELIAASWVRVEDLRELRALL